MVPNKEAPPPKTGMPWREIFGGLGGVVLEQIASHPGPYRAVFIACAVVGLALLWLFSPYLRRAVVAAFVTAFGAALIIASWPEQQPISQSSAPAVIDTTSQHNQRMANARISLFDKAIGEGRAIVRSRVRPDSLIGDEQMANAAVAWMDKYQKRFNKLGESYGSRWESAAGGRDMLSSKHGAATRGMVTTGIEQRDSMLAKWIDDLRP